MQRLIAVATLMSIAGLAHGEPSIDCSALSAPQLVQSAGATAPVAGELGVPDQPLGVVGGVLAQPATEMLSAEQVLYRQQLENCGSLAGTAAPAAAVAPELAAPVAPDALPAVSGAEAVVASAVPAATPTAEVIDAATYKPRTEFDNTPWRFNMDQGGERMTADAFAAWMEAKGVRVAKGRAPVVAEGEAAVLAPEGAESAAGGEAEQGEDE